MRPVRVVIATAVIAAACSTGGIAGPSGVPVSSTVPVAPWMTSALPIATTTTEGVRAVTPSSVVVPTPTRIQVPEPIVIGVSVQGRPLEAVTLGAGDRRIYVVGSIHGDERPAVENSIRLVEIVGSLISDDVTLRWVLDANPDGAAANSRTNARGVDLNRNWPTDHQASPDHGPRSLSEPETVALSDDIERFSPDVVVVLHADRGGPFANYDGDGQGLARAFATGASLDRRWGVVADIGVPTPGSLGTHFGVGLGVPTISVVLDPRDDPASVLGELVLGFSALFDAVA